MSTSHASCRQIVVAGASQETRGGSSCLRRAGAHGRAIRASARGKQPHGGGWSSSRASCGCYSCSRLGDDRGFGRRRYETKASVATTAPAMLPASEAISVGSTQFMWLSARSCSFPPWRSPGTCRNSWSRARPERSGCDPRPRAAPSDPAHRPRGVGRRRTEDHP